MNRGSKPAPAIMLARMNVLPLRHRLAHLRALIRQQPAGSVRRQQLAAMLRDELTALNLASPSALAPLSPSGRRSKTTA
jgi:hypothetical protein